jgi:hypothetical protein
VDEYEDTFVVQLATLLHLDAILLKGAQELMLTLCHLGQPRITRGRRATDHHLLDLGMRPSGGAEVPAFPVRKDRAHEVHVLRHRLHRQARRPKRLGGIEVEADARDLAVVKVEDRRSWRVDRHTAALPASGITTEHEDLVTEIAVLLNDRAKLLPAFLRIA